jgi:FSR family fosmidomycin resistance protein-like MFS transporter
VLVLIALILSKYFYLACMASYYTFYLIHKFDTSIQLAQIFLFIFLFSVAVGTIIGGPVGDRFGRKVVIWISILGVAPFSLLLPHVGLLWVGVLSVPIGLVLASAFRRFSSTLRSSFRGKSDWWPGFSSAWLLEWEE